MVIEKTIPVNLQKISDELGVSLNDLQVFLSGRDLQRYKKIKKETLSITVIDEYTKNLKDLVNMNKRSKETWKTYNNFIKRLRQFICDFCPTLPINELNEILLNKVIRHNSKHNDSYSTKTLNKYNAILKSIMKFAYERDYSKKNFSYKFSIQNNALVPRYIKDEDIIRILEAIKHFPKPHRCRAIIIFLLGTGCRVSEVSNIKVKNFDINNDLIFIENGKGKKERYIPMFPEIKDEITYYLKMSGMDEWDPNCNGYLFARDEGTIRERNFPIRTIEYLIERIRTRVPNIDSITVHTFRHTFSVKCLKLGISLHNLSLILGHSDPKTTMVYTQLYNEDLKDQITKKFPFPFEKLLSTILDNPGKTK